MKFLSLLLLFCVLAFASCSSDPCGSSKDAFVKNYTAFYEKIKTNHKTMQAADWEKEDLVMRKMIKECSPKYKADLSLGEQKDFWIGAIRYYNARYGVVELGLQMMKGGEMIDDVVKAIKEFGLDWKSLVSF